MPKKWIGLKRYIAIPHFQPNLHMSTEQAIWNYPVDFRSIQ